MWYYLVQFDMTLWNNEWFLETNCKNECESNIYTNKKYLVQKNDLLLNFYQWYFIENKSKFKWIKTKLNSSVMYHISFLIFIAHLMYQDTIYLSDLTYITCHRGFLKPFRDFWAPNTIPQWSRMRTQFNQPYNNTWFLNNSLSSGCILWSMNDNFHVTCCRQRKRTRHE